MRHAFVKDRKREYERIREGKNQKTIEWLIHIYSHHGETESAKNDDFFLKKSDHWAPNSALRGKLLREEF